MKYLKLTKMQGYQQRVWKIFQKIIKLLKKSKNLFQNLLNQ